MRRVFFGLMAAFLASPDLALADDEAELKKIVKWARPVVGSQCDFPEFENGERIEAANHIYRFDYRYSYETETDTPHTNVQ